MTGAPPKDPKAEDREDLTTALADLRLAEQALRRVVARQKEGPARHFAGQAEAHCDVACRAIRRGLLSLDE